MRQHKSSYLWKHVNTGQLGCLLANLHTHSRHLQSQCGVEVVMWKLIGLAAGFPTLGRHHTSSKEAWNSPGFSFVVGSTLEWEAAAIGGKSFHSGNSVRVTWIQKNVNDGAVCAWNLTKGFERWNSPVTSSFQHKPRLLQPRSKIIFC